VLDTNVYVSAIFGGVPEDVYRAACRGQFILITSPPILAELAQTLRIKFFAPEADITAYVKQIARVSMIVRPEGRLTIVADDADNRVLECAVVGNADLIVSGDRHLLALREYSGIPIVRPIDFFRTLGS